MRVYLWGSESELSVFPGFAGQVLPRMFSFAIILFATRSMLEAGFLLRVEKEEVQKIWMLVESCY
jgi:hypothetical protein